MEPGEEDAPAEPCCFDDWVDCWERKASRKATVAGVTDHLLTALEETGIRGRTVLDVGCGIGDLAIETVARGASSATGFDLSAKAIEEARQLARSRGVADRTRFEVGDGAEVDLPPADVVVLNRVICCYPHVEALVERTISAAGSAYAFSTPVSRGLIGRLNRFRSDAWAAYYRLRPKKYGGFRSWVHDVDRIDERLRSAGFRRVHRERRRVVWDLAVYAR